MDDHGRLASPAPRPPSGSLRPWAGSPIALVLVLFLAACGGGPSSLPSSAATSTASSEPPRPGPTAAPVPSLPGEACLGMPAGASSEIALSVDGTVRNAVVHVPRSTAATTPTRPVVLVFHGYADLATAVEDMTGFSAKAEEAGFVVVYPQALGAPPKWDVAGATDTAFVSALLRELAGDPCVDPARTYAVGMSMGGGMANIVACRLAGRIAGLGTVAGLYGPNWGEPCDAARPVPVIAFHGLLDPQVPYAGGPIVDPEMGSGGNPDLPAVIGVEAWASAWAERDGCRPGQPQTAIGKVVPVFWQGCIEPVELYRVTDGGHTWPGSSWNEPLTNHDVSATDLIWNFLTRFTLAGG